MSRVLIRQGRKEDSQELVRLLDKLVEYEGYEKWEDTIQVKRFQSDGFGEQPWFHTFVAEVKDETGNEKLVGFCLYNYMYAMRSGRRSYLECLYVEPEWRHHGLGKRLCKAHIKEALNRNCTSIALDAHYNNTPACNLYKSIGAINITEKFDYHMFVIGQKEMESFTMSE